MSGQRWSPSPRNARSGVAEGGVGPYAVIVVSPGGQDGPGVVHRGEQRLVEALVAQPAVEALDEAVAASAILGSRPAAQPPSQGITLFRCQ